MKALSLWQPHASAIDLGLKQYETRSWRTSYRGPLVIHAAKKEFKFDESIREYFMEVSGRLRGKNFPMYALDGTYGRALCVVDLVDCVPTASLRGRIGRTEFWGDFRDVGDDGKPRFALKLENVRRIFPRPKVVGRQRFFEIEESLLKFLT